MTAKGEGRDALRFLFSICYAVLWSTLAVVAANLLGASDYYTGYAAGSVAMFVLYLRDQ